MTRSHFSPGISHNAIIHAILLLGLTYELASSKPAMLYTLATVFTYTWWCALVLFRQWRKEQQR